MHRLTPLRPQRFTSFLFAVLTFLGVALIGAPAATGQSFTSSGLVGENVGNPTSLQFGPDGRLYVSQQNGEIDVMTVQRNGPNDYVVTDLEEIDLVQKYVPNHDDDGTPNATQQRQVTGIVVTGTATNPVLYVSSSDWRIGAGGGGNDKDLDTNSGVISRLTWVGAGVDDPNGFWDKVDIIRGLPRSEENHSTNGMVLDGGTLLVAQGGHANAGAPSNNFAFTTDYALSAAILRVDLQAIDAMSVKTDNGLYAGYTYQWIYDLPTLDDPTRDNVGGVNDPSASGYPTPGFTDPNDPFGGNDGLNQAKLVSGGPVQIHSPGYRNLYDLVLTESGRLYGVDNGANGGWGGHPDGEADFPDEYTTNPTCTNDYIDGEPGSTGTGPGGDPKVNNKNGLHYIRDLQPGDYNYVAGQTPYYAGHPVPTRGNPSGAGLYTKGTHTVAPDGSDAMLRTQILSPSDPDFKTQSLPVDWGTVVPAANPVECDFRNSGETDGALANFGPSTNGITEYTASNLNGDYTGVLLAAGFNGNIYQIELSADGTTATNCPAFTDGQTLSNCNSTFASGFGSKPLDVIAQGDNDPFGGTVWAATYGADAITIFEPGDYEGGSVGVCNGTDDPTIDEDGDLYHNADEIANGTDPCSGASLPDDFDGSFAGSFKDSNLLDPDDDDDGLNDTVDPFAWDASNGAAYPLPLNLELFNNTGYGFGDVGFTGLMINGDDDYLDLIVDNDDIIFGGTSGLYTIPAEVMSSGDPFGNNNSQTNAFQFGVNVDASTPPFLITAAMEGPFFGNSNPVDFQSQGVQIGTGDQDNYLKLTLTVTNTGPGFQLLYEDGGSKQADQKFGGIPDLLSNNLIEARLIVDPGQGTVQPQIAYGSGEGDLVVQTLGSPVALTGNVLAAVQGTYQVNGTPTKLAVGPLATNFNAGPSNAFAATWDLFYVEELPSASAADIAVTPGTNINASTFANGSFSIQNTSSTASITSVEINASSAVLRDVVFDPNGTAGDATSKDLTVGSESGGDGSVGIGAHTFSGARDGGFDVLTIPFGDFEPGETVTFGVDMDPTSINGTTAPGPGESGSVSGLELSGASVTVTFSDGAVHVTDLFSTAGSNSGSEATATSPLPDAPSVGVQGVPLATSGPFQAATVSTASQTITVDAPSGSLVRLVQLEAALFEDPAGGFDVDPFEANSVTSVSEQSATIDGSGSASFGVSLSPVDAVSGATTTLNHFLAVVERPDGTTGRASETVVVAYDPSTVPSPLVRINAGGATVSDDDLDWSASSDVDYTGGKKYPANNPSSNPVDVTQDPDAGPELLYQTELYGGKDGADFTYNVPITGSGPFDVKLHFAEIFQGVNNSNGAGARIFDVLIEGALVLDDYDVIAEAGGPLIAIVETATGVTDADGSGTIDITFAASVDNAKISAIEILDVGSGPANQPPQLSAIPDQTNAEGDDVSLAIAATDDDGPNNLDYSATGLPPGLSVEPTNGQIFGTVAAGAAANSPYAVTVSVGDGAATSTTSFQWTVTAPVGPSIVINSPQDGDTFTAPDVSISWTATTSVSDDHVHVTLGDRDYVGSQPLNGTYAFDDVAPGTYLLKVVVANNVHDEYTNPEATATVTVNVVPASTETEVLFRVNAGGPELPATGDSDLVWSADNGGSVSPYLAVAAGGTGTYSGNSNSAHAGSIVMTDPSVALSPGVSPDLFNTERYDLPAAPEMTYSFPVSESGSYAVRLFFAELFGQITASGQRVFDVSVEGSVPTEFASLDPFAIAGAKGAFVREAVVDVTDGSLDVTFLHDVENPALKGIEILSVGAAPANQPPVLAAISDQTNVVGDAVSLPVSASDPDVGDVLTYSADNLPLGLSIDPATGQISGTIPEGEGAFQEDGGLVVIEMESADLSGTGGLWTNESTEAGFTGSGYLRAENQFLSTPGNGILAFPVEISTPGTYQFLWRNQIGQGTVTTEHNDSWLKIESDGFYGQKGSSIVCPKGLDAAENDCSGGSPNGAGAGGWFKVYSSGASSWSYSTKVSDNDAHDVFARFDEAGTYTVYVSVRSVDHLIDRMVLAKTGEGLTPTNTSLDESARSASAVGTYAASVTATDPGNLSDTQSFTWTVEAADPGDAVPSMTFTVTPNANFGASTFGSGSLTLTNTGDVPITSVVIDLSTALLPDVVWDPEGSAGDAAGKCLTVSSADQQEVGLLTQAPGGSAAPCADGFSAPRDNGFDVLTLEFSNFDPGESMAFAADIDPTSIQGDGNTGDAGSISGMELIGSAITATFDDLGGTVLTGSLWEDGSNGGGQALLQPGAPAAPVIAISGLQPPVVTSQPAQTVELTGPVDAPFALLHVDARLYIDDVIDPDNDGTPGFDVDPFEANEAVVKTVYTGTFSSSGTATVPVTLLQTPGTNGTPDAGLNHFVAVTLGTETVQGIPQTSSSSAVLVVELGDEGPAEVTASVGYDSGWNLVGLPVQPADASADAVFPTALPNTLFGFSGAYTAPGALTAGEGYWLQFGQSGSQSVTGTEISSVSIDLESGWNLVTGPSCSIPFTSLQDPGGVVAPGTFFGFAGAYTLPSSFEPGDGYWLQATGSGTVTLDCADASAAVVASKASSVKTSSDAPTLVLTDARGLRQTLLLSAPASAATAKSTGQSPAASAFPMPPLPPGASFDARYEGDTRLLPAPESRILLQATSYPITVRLTGPVQAKTSGTVNSGAVYVDEMVGATVVASHELVPSGTITLTHTDASTLRVRTADALPSDFRLMGNYPNPFRGTTTIAVDVPEPATVQVDVYDLLGRRVMHLEPRRLMPGTRQTLAIDAQRLGAGAYFYRLRAEMPSGTVVETGRMTLVR